MAKPRIAAVTLRQTAQALGLEAAAATAGWEAPDGTFVPMTLNQQRELLMTGGAKYRAASTGGPSWSRPLTRPSAILRSGPSTSTPAGRRDVSRFTDATFVVTDSRKRGRKVVCLTSPMICHLGHLKSSLLITGGPGSPAD